MNNTRVDITPRTIETDTMDGATSTIQHLLTGNNRLERVELSMFALRLKNPNIFLANFVDGDIIVTSFIKHLFRAGPDFLVHLAGSWSSP
jgi:hypothetical protein